MHIFVNGTAIQEHNAAHSGPENNIWTGPLGPSDNMVIWQADNTGAGNYEINFASNTLAAGTLSTNRTSLCASGGTQNHNDFTATFSVASHVGTVEQFEYQWDGTGGTWQTDWTHTGTSKTFANNGTNPGKVLYVRARVGLSTAAGCTPVADVYTNTVQVNVFNPSSGDAFGDGEWIAHAYNNSDLSLQNYAGFYTQKGLSYNSQDRWGATLSPASAVDVTDGNGTSLGYVGCGPGGENHAMASKRTNFGACTLYQLGGRWDDRARLYVNGTEVYAEYGNDGNYVPNLWTGELGPNDSIEFRHRDVTSYSYQELIFTPITLTAGTLASNLTDPCPTQTTTFSVTGNTGYVEQFEYQWDGTGGTWQTDWTNTTATTQNWYNSGTNTGTVLYVRARVGVKQDGNCAAPADVYTNTIQITPMNQASGSIYGDNEWISHAYWNSALNLPPLNYRGFYTQKGLSYDTRPRWNASLSPAYAGQVINGTDTSDAYIGCDPGNDYHAISTKRKGFGTCTFYQVDLFRDDDCQLYVNGELKFSLAGYGAYGGAWYGELGPNDSIEFRTRDFLYGSVQALTFIPINLTAGTLSTSSKAICSNIGTQTATFSVAGYVGTVEQFEYQWDGTNGTWQTDWTKTSPSTQNWTNTGTNPGSVLYVRARVGVNDGGGSCTPPADVYTNVVKVTVSAHNASSGSEWGNNKWITHAYNQNDFNLNPAVYTGFYTETGLSYNTVNRWDVLASPFHDNDVTANAYVGCDPGNDSHTIASKRIGFPCGTYDLKGRHDDWAQVYVNGDLVYAENAVEATLVDFWYGELGPTDSVMFIHREGAGGSYQELAFTLVDSVVPGTIDSDAPANGGICLNDVTTFEAAGFSGGVVQQFEYQWDGTAGAWSAWTPTTVDTYEWTYDGLNAGTTLYVRGVIGLQCGGTSSYTDTISVHVNPTYDLAETVSVCSGDSYTFPDGTVQNNITAQVVYTSNIQTTTACDSSITTTVNVDPLYSLTESVSVCSGESYTFPDGSTQSNITAQTVHTSNLLTAAGCDSSITTTVNVNPTYALAESASICSGGTYTFPDGTQVNVTTQAVHTSYFQTATACDSSITTTVTANPTYALTASASVCSGDSYTFPDGSTQSNITAQAVHTSNLLTAAGCDSSITTTVNVNPTYALTASASVCSGASYTFPDGSSQSNITAQTVHTSNLQTAAGCDSSITTTVNVNPTYALTASASV
ncbi:hypothetical protein ACFLR1_06595, partial [Bacteroidota bacterium]